MSEIDEDELLADLGLEVVPLKVSSRTPREERIIAGFEDVLRFHQTHGRPPQHGEGRDIFERLYAVRLDQIRKLPEAQTLLTWLDGPGLLADAAAASAPVEVGDMDEDALLAELGIGESLPDPNDITVLRHVRSSTEKRAAEEIADRMPCADFETFQSLFERAERELKSGVRKALRFGRDTSIADGNFFIVGGQLAYVADVGETFKARNGESDARLRVIYANGTESNLLRRSLQRALYKDDTGRRLTDPDMGPLFGPQFGDTPEPDDIESGTIYVLRSLSNHPFVTELA
ncbi:MAG: GIY-YIG nuclease family protein [Rhodocyclaceae bacterium]|nr:GIY-YIG nuclease family protein [Rhodocyclaceae bacterium]MDZ4214956.1 GIY-YIG nuclease family protein [Rhodocyclaceae bacterium]